MNILYFPDKWNSKQKNVRTRRPRTDRSSRIRSGKNSYRRNCRFCGERIVMVCAPDGHWIALDIPDGSPHGCMVNGKKRSVTPPESDWFPSFF